MGYANDDKVLNAVKDVVHFASGQRTWTGVDRITKVHRWARRFVAPNLPKSSSFLSFARNDGVSVDKGTVSPRQQKLGFVKIEVSAGLATLELWFRESDGTYEYHHCVLS